MSMTAVRSYFRARAASQSWKEWPDPFGDDNIPSSVIDQGFHLPPFTTGVGRQNQADVEFPVTQQVVYFKKGFRDVASGLDSAISASETYIKSCLKASNRLTGSGLKNVKLAGVNIGQLGNNQALIRVTMSFNCDVIIDTEN